MMNYELLHHRNWKFLDHLLTPLMTYIKDFYVKRSDPIIYPSSVPHTIKRPDEQWAKTALIYDKRVPSSTKWLDHIPNHSEPSPATIHI